MALNRIQRGVMESLKVELPKNSESRNAFVQRLIRERSGFLREYLVTTPAKGYVLGISGGVDSFVASMLAKESGNPIHLYSLPYGAQKDMRDVLDCVEIIGPDSFEVSDIQAAVDAELADADPSQQGYHKMKGNVMARIRMVRQYRFAEAVNCLVLGTDHATEAITGFYTKYGDGAADLTPLSGLTKDTIYEMAKFFHAPDAIIQKAPTAGLWENQTDEDELGLRYSDICAYLQGRAIDPPAAAKLEKIYQATEHKRHLPAEAGDLWWRLPGASLLAIDCQYDFIEGSLACQRAHHAVENIAGFLHKHPGLPVFYTLDWHPASHCSFAGNGGTWPVHCVQDTRGASLAPLFHTLEKGLSPDRNNCFYKGTDAGTEEYSAFHSVNKEGRRLADCLKSTVIVCGIATEFCVRETILHLLEAGKQVLLLENCLGFVNLEAHQKNLEELEGMGVRLFTA